jgi:hypothetical protein
MSADLLREAATTLRERAEAATPGPWSHYPDTFRTDIPVHRLGSNAAQDAGGVGDVGLTPAEHPHGFADAAYIATVHPGVGLALADWLDDVAAELEQVRCHLVAAFGDDKADDYMPDVPAKTLTLARLIVGRQS